MAEQTPQGMFVLHVRSDSDLGRGHVVGRVEHVMSGDDELFGSLEVLLAFVRIHVALTSQPREPRDNATKGGNSNDSEA
jgi:hypothetical protein